MKIRQLNFSDQAALFFKEPGATTGLIFLLASFIFLGNIFHVGIITDSCFYLYKDLGKVSGSIKEIYDTKSSNNKQRIKSIHYTYTINGQTYQKTAFSEGGGFKKADKVTVEYIVSHPKIARIKGTRNAKFPGVTLLFILIFTAIGGSVMYFSIQSVIKKSRILLNGQLHHGKLVESTQTMIRINKRPLYKLIFEYIVDDKKYTNTTKTLDPVILMDEKTERLIYNKKEPSESVMLDVLPRRFHSWF